MYFKKSSNNPNVSSEWKPMFILKTNCWFLMMDMNDFSGLFQLGKFAKIYIYADQCICITNSFFLNEFTFSIRTTCQYIYIVLPNSFQGWNLNPKLATSFILDLPALHLQDNTLKHNDIPMTQDCVHRYNWSTKTRSSVVFNYWLINHYMLAIPKTSPNLFCFQI